MRSASISSAFGMRIIALSFLTSVVGCPSPTPGKDAGSDGPVTTADAAMGLSLAAPAAGKGFQLQSDSLDIPAATEIQACYFLKVPDVNGDGKDFFVDNIEVAQSPGTHHMNIFRPGAGTPSATLKGGNADGTGSVVSTGGTTPPGACFVSSNWATWPLVVNDQASEPGKNFVFQLPAHVGERFTPGEILMLQTHYVNATTQTTPGAAKVFVNFNQIADATNLQELGTIFATEQAIAICQGDVGVKYTGACHINATAAVDGGTPPAVTIVAANGHFHSRGTDFNICNWDGVSTGECASKATNNFYESTTWNDPPMTTGLDVAVAQNGGITWTCTYDWSPSPACSDGCSCLTAPKAGVAPAGATCCYGFGGIVETSEHCNAFVYYYPKLNTGDISCK